MREHNFKRREPRHKIIEILDLKGILETTAFSSSRGKHVSERVIDFPKAKAARAPQEQCWVCLQIPHSLNSEAEDFVSLQCFSVITGLVFIVGAC